jgi:hypothetical protein
MACDHLRPMLLSSMGAVFLWSSCFLPSPEYLEVIEAREQRYLLVRRPTYGYFNKAGIGIRFVQITIVSLIHKV